MEIAKLNLMSANQLKTKSRIKAMAVYAVCVIIMLVAVLIKFIAIEKLPISENKFLVYFCFSVAFIAVAGVQIVYLISSRSSLVCKLKSFSAYMASITFTFILCLFLELVSPFIMPICAAAFIIAPLSRRRDAFMGNLYANIVIVLVLATQYILSNQSLYPLIIMFSTGIFIGSLASYWIANDTKRIHYILKSMTIAFLGLGFVFLEMTIFSIKTPNFLDVFLFISIGMFGHIILAQLLQPLLEAIFNLLTNTRLVELTDHNSPLIKRLISEAPGTFNHCLAVANFAEMCAGAIGENQYLARACAYYHDIGKLTEPEYFKENQDDYNPHDELLPEISADIIRAHTTDGLRLCNEYRIPKEIADITIMHHGTLPIYVFYNKAKKLTDGDVDISEYSYHGVVPESKVAAIIMLCDTGEAAIRAMVNPDPDKVDKLLRSLISERISAGQFDYCDISLRDLNRIRETIINAYGGQFHKRLAYPDGKTTARPT